MEGRMVVVVVVVVDFTSCEEVRVRKFDTCINIYICTCTCIYNNIYVATYTYIHHTSYMYAYVMYNIIYISSAGWKDWAELYFSTFPHPPLTTALSSQVVVRVTHDDTYHHTTR
jgi:hypothetical protein